MERPRSTFETFLRENVEREVIDFSMRASVDSSGTVRFYVHPSGKDGETLDFQVLDNALIPDPRT